MVSRVFLGGFRGPGLGFWGPGLQGLRVLMLGAGVEFILKIGFRVSFESRFYWNHSTPSSGFCVT